MLMRMTQTHRATTMAPNLPTKYTHTNTHTNRVKYIRFAMLLHLNIFSWACRCFEGVWHLGQSEAQTNKAMLSADF